MKKTYLVLCSAGPYDIASRILFLPHIINLHQQDVQLYLVTLFFNIWKKLQMKTCRQRDHRSARMEKNDGRYHRYRRGDRIVRDSPGIIPSTGTCAGAKPSLKGKFRCLGLLSGVY